MSRVQSALVFGSTLLAVFALVAEPALACGGLFCSASAPVNQAAERIVFTKNADGTVTAVVQIQYEGPSEEFAWVLPVPGVPDVEVSSDLAFTRLQLASNPQYNLNTVFEGNCQQSDVALQGGTGGGGGNFGSGGAGGSGRDGVTVLAEGNVGPYDYVVILPEASFQEIGDVAVDWLVEEGYDVVPPGGDPGEISSLLGSYLEDGMNLIAFRLTKGNDEGTIRPIRITYATDQPMIPIRPTAVAANDDMGVMVWVLGQSRAVPVNYRSLELNEARIDWLTGGGNYNAVVIEAANEAGGQGFVTERASASSDYENVIVRDFERDAWIALNRDAGAMTPQELAIASLQFSSWDGYREVLEDFLPQSDVEALLECPGCGLPVMPFDKQAFLEALASEVYEPMAETDELVASLPYVTRFYTTLSAPEMDRDPLFDFNADLDDVSNVHTATRVIECNDNVSFFDAPSRVELEDGRMVRLEPGQPWPFGAEEDAPPANALVAQLTTSGPGTVVADNRDAIDAALDEHNASVPGPPGSGRGCSVGAIESGTTLSLLAVVFGLLIRRRRPRRIG